MLKKVPINTRIYNIESRFSRGGQLVKAAGTFGRILQKYTSKKGNEIMSVELPSKRIYYISGNCMASIGIVSNIEKKSLKLKKGGVNRDMGIRPRVRGVAMNPVDHPHGGGTGKTTGGRPSVTPWGFLTKGRRTRSEKRFAKYNIFRKKINKKLY